MNELNNLRNVIKSGLCNRCGTCVGLSDGNIIFLNKTGAYLPVIINNPGEEESKRIWQACPGKYFDFRNFRQLLYPGDNHFHVFTGSFKNIYIGYSQDEEIRMQAASGGILSAILIWLLEKKMIDGAVVLGMSVEEPWMNQPLIATTREQILQAAQSKYTISSVNEILSQIAGFNGRLAYVGLPGQVQSIRKLQEMNDPVVQNIKYVFGPFYGNTLHFSSIIDFMRSYGERDYRQIRKLWFRHGEWPGNMRIEMQNGRVIELPKFHANYLIPFHILKNSLLCTDLSNEFTDISGGDAWAPVYEERGKGYSMVIARSIIGQQILNEMTAEGRLSLQPITIDEAITMHSHGYDLKKRGTFIRLWFRKLLGQEVPDYGYTISGFPFSRYIMEFFIGLLFLAMGTRPARWVASQIPPRRIGAAFEHFRKWWKQATHHIKRDNLDQ